MRVIYLKSKEDNRKFNFMQQLKLSAVACWMQCQSMFNFLMKPAKEDGIRKIPKYPSIALTGLVLLAVTLTITACEKSALPVDGENQTLSQEETAITNPTTTIAGTTTTEQPVAFTLPPCGLQTEFIRDITNFETVILKNHPGNEKKPFILYDKKGPTSLYGCFEGEPEIIWGSQMIICNYPQYAEEWEIPEEGLPIVVSGKVYAFDGNVEAMPNIVVYYLELVSINKK
jgi:hypothetical protein